MAIKTYTLLALQAKLIKETMTSFWGAIGKTSEWTNEPVPDAEVPTTSSILQPIVYVKSEYSALCYQINTGTEDVTVRGRKYKFCSSSDAITYSARFIYLRFRLDPTVGQPYADFRQFGVYCNLTPIAGHTADLWLPPAYVSSPGDLVFYNNRRETLMSADNQQTIQVII